MKKTVVINVVGLTRKLIGEHTPFLQNYIINYKLNVIKPVFPAVTCSAQATYITGKWPSEHGIVGNGWYFQDLHEVKFWHQSHKLVQSPTVWHWAMQQDPAFTCSYMFWWYNMYSGAHYSATPRPQYWADGRKYPDIYTHPDTLRDELQDKLGTFPLFDFWGPKTSIKSSRWIADASIMADEKYNPTLTFIYLPHLDYNMQRYGNNFAKISADLKDIDHEINKLVTYYQDQNANIIILSEYGISDVHTPIALNRIFRNHGLLKIRVENGLELLDPGASKAFAVADHQVAHIYTNDMTMLNKVKKILEQMPGIAQVLDDTEKKTMNINHPRAGHLIAVAEAGHWFSYYYWNDDAKAPDFARIVDIHKKPGYDPVEMFADPNIKFLTAKVIGKLIQKKLGFRMLMDIIPLDATLIKGSHGAIPHTKDEWPVCICAGNASDEIIEPTQIYEIIKNSLLNN
ncbi:MAG: alkaline phosphatase family protein [Cytophagales bacterium]|nr:alkaline phosphatase family protein [Cytophagales bacterium]